MTANNKKDSVEPLVVEYVGFGGVIEVPCYKDQNGRYYFDENNGRNGLALYTGAWREEGCGEICGEPNERVTRPVICEKPFVRSPYEFDYMMLGRWRADCDYFLGYGNGYEGHLCLGTVEAICDAMEEKWNSFPDDAKPQWLSLEQIKEYRQKMLAKRAERQAEEAKR